MLPQAPCRAPRAFAVADSRIGKITGTGESAIRASRRWRVGPRHHAQAAEMGRGERPRGRHLVPLPGPVRQPQRELRWRRRHRHQPQARAAGEGSRCPARHRRAPGRDDDERLHAGRCARAAPDPGARARRRRGARPRLPARARHQLRQRAVCGSFGFFFIQEFFVARKNRNCPQRIPRVDRAAADAGRGAVRRDHPLALGAAAGGRDRRRRRGQLRRLAASAFPLQGLPYPARLDQRLDGLRLSRRGRGEAGRAEAHGCSRSAATATS